MESIPSSVTSGAGFQYCNALLASYAVNAKKLTFTTLTPGLESGQLLTVNLPALGLNNESMLIESIAISFKTGQDVNGNGYLVYYAVTAIEGPVDEDWTRFFKDLIKRTEEFTIPQNQTNDQMASLEEALTDSYTFTDGGAVCTAVTGAVVRSVTDPQRWKVQSVTDYANGKRAI